MLELTKLNSTGSDVACNCNAKTHEIWRLWLGHWLLSLMHDPYGRIMLERTRKPKAKISLIFVAIQCKHTTEKSMYPFRAMSLFLSLQWNCSITCGCGVWGWDIDCWAWCTTGALSELSRRAFAAYTAAICRSGTTGGLYVVPPRGLVGQELAALQVRSKILQSRTIN